MKLPLSWLVEFVNVRVEPRRLGEDLTLAGFALAGLETLDKKDVVLDLEVTTNRVDCMNVLGLAREVSVLYGEPLRGLDVAPLPSGTENLPLDVIIESAELCPRFTALVLDVLPSPSPAWLRERLELVGVRPVNNVVDVTNYVMLEMGQPSHAFDLLKIPEQRLRVRWSKEGERLRTLDGVERVLSEGIGVVAGRDGPLALAGIMGGEATEVSDATRVVALEAAYWKPQAIRRASRQLGLHTEASHRFERGTDPEAPLLAVSRIAHLLQRIGGGQPRGGALDRLAAQPCPPSILLRSSRLRSVLGTPVPDERAHDILRGLGFAVGEASSGAVRVQPPTWRGDVSREVDLIEEVGRHYGIDKVPVTLPAARAPGGRPPSQSRQRLIVETLVGAGLTEVVNYTFASPAQEGAAPTPMLRLQNPLAGGQEGLRNTLVPGLLSTLKVNLRQGRRDLQVFEIGRVFLPGEPLPCEERRLGILLCGALGQPHWSQKPPSADFFALKGLLELVAIRLGMEPLALASGSYSFLHPGQSASLLWSGKAVGFLGCLHPQLAETLGLRSEAVVAEVGLEGILDTLPGPRLFRSLPRFPQISRDLSIVCDRALPASAIEGVIREAAGDKLVSVTLTDRYDRPPVPPGRVSLTLTLRYQDPERTLTSEEVQVSVGSIAGKLKAMGAEIRGE